MSKVEKCKSTIDLLKSVLISILVALFGMVGYWFVNMQKITILQSIFLGLGIIVALIAVIIATKFIIKKLNELGDL